MNNEIIKLSRCSGKTESILIKIIEAICRQENITIDEFLEELTQRNYKNKKG